MPPKSPFLKCDWLASRSRILFVYDKFFFIFCIFQCQIQRDLRQYYISSFKRYFFSFYTSHLIYLELMKASISTLKHFYFGKLLVSFSFLRIHIISLKGSFGELVSPYTSSQSLEILAMLRLVHQIIAQWQDFLIIFGLNNILAIFLLFS